MIRLKNWITVDPLKLKKLVRFNPGDYRQPPVAWVPDPSECHS
jgi:hypothetical protein